MKFQVPVNKVAEDTVCCQEHCRPVLHCTHALMLQSTVRVA